MISFLKLIRYKNLLMVALTMLLTKYALIPYYLSKSNLSDIEFIILSLSVILITASGYIVNDIFDIETDIINKPNKTFINNKLSINKVWILYFLFSISGLVFGIYLSIEKQQRINSFYFIAAVIALFIYSKYLKRLPLLGNILIAILIPLVIYLVYDFDKKLFLKCDFLNDLFLSITVFYYLIFAFLSTFIRELVKDIEDLKGDYNAKMKTLPILIGRTRVRNLVIVLTSLLLFFVVIILSESISSVNYAFAISSLVISLQLSHCLYKLWNAKTKKQFQYLSQFMKFIMLLGILSMGLFKLN